MREHAQNVTRDYPFLSSPEVETVTESTQYSEIQMWKYYAVLQL